jgi:hypothetical protein
MWGGTPDRNMVSGQKVVSSWDVKTGKNVKWVAALGSQTYGNPVIAGGRVIHRGPITNWCAIRPLRAIAAC